MPDEDEREDETPLEEVLDLIVEAKVVNPVFGDVDELEDGRDFALEVGFTIVVKVVALVLGEDDADEVLGIELDVYDKEVLEEDFGDVLEA